MAVFLLVHGAWHGGWCWAELEKQLHSLGHQTHAPTLTGPGERSHLAHPDINADSHVTDVVNTIKWRELHDVILVGHSYGGMVITGVAEQIPQKIRSLVYLDAVVPEQSGISLFAKANPDRVAGFEKQLEHGGFTIEPDLFDAWTDDPVRKDWLKRMCTPHPVRCFREGVTLTGKEQQVKDRLYILAERNQPSAFWAEYDKVNGRPGWTCQRIATKHDVMVEQPAELAGILHDYINPLEER